ncbi:MAG TPA: transposase [Noviherbaspirillum sp.]|nr:transposase [Noviherbaspirillum sp.]
MARLPRLVAPNQPHHVTQSGLDSLTIFRDAQDFQIFHGWLREAARQFKVSVHAYVVMPDHFQLLATPHDEHGLGRMMQWIGRKYVPYFNARYARQGTLWQGRYKATVVDASSYLLLCSRYIEQLPVRAGLALSVADYPWSSASHHAGLKPDALITDHAAYWALGNTPFAREAAYRALVDQNLSADEVGMLNGAVRRGWPLGPNSFQQDLARRLGRRVSPSRRGRPARKAEAERKS